jgi:hypothetical protein
VQAAHAQVGVVQRVGLGVGDDLGQPVRPAAVAALDVGILEPFGARVADRHITPESPHPPILVLSKDLRKAAWDSPRGLRRYPMPAGERVLIQV